MWEHDARRQTERGRNVGQHLLITMGKLERKASNTEPSFEVTGQREIKIECYFRVRSESRCALKQGVGTDVHERIYILHFNRTATF
jgi:hypothetical protein